MGYDPYATRSGRLSRYAEVSRRQFLLIMGAFAALGALILGGVKTLGFLFPGATNEAPPEFTVQTDPKSLVPGQVLQITDKRVSVVRDDKGFYAVFLVCTHLGCTPNYTTDVAGDLGGGLDEQAKKRGQRSGDAVKADGWACPCHGSRYFIDSTNFYGPAPRPMDWVLMKLVNGRLIVDRSQIVVRRGSGDSTPPTWRLDPSGHVTGSGMGA